MKAKKLILNILASVGMVLLVLPMFLAMYTATVSIGNKVADPATYGIFTNWTYYINAYKVAGKTFAQTWAVLTDVLAVVLLILAVLYVVMFVLKLLKVGKKVNYTKIMKLLAVVILVLTILALVTAIIFTSTNSLSIKVLVETKYTFGFGIGLIMMLIGGVVTGLCGLLANLKK